jgi:hypothetical protein
MATYRATFTTTISQQLGYQVVPLSVSPLDPLPEESPDA